jgi:hypothetical protein
MKARKTLTHQLLLVELFEQLKFQVKVCRRLQLIEWVGVIVQHDRSTYLLCCSLHNSRFESNRSLTASISSAMVLGMHTFIWHSTALRPISGQGKDLVAGIGAHWVNHTRLAHSRADSHYWKGARTRLSTRRRVHKDYVPL